MPKLFITPENQIQRLNHIINQVRTLQTLDSKMLTTTRSPKSWNIIEVIEHLNISYGHYVDKIEKALSKSPTITGANEPFKARPWQRFVINGQRPKNGKRKWKMKTLKRFEPLLSNDELSKEKVDAIFLQFEKAHTHLKESILASRSKDISKVTFSSAIGNIVRFYLPEAFEFLLCHAERHMVQIEKTKFETGQKVFE